jgi:hypothetical protein
MGQVASTLTTTPPRLIRNNATTNIKKSQHDSSKHDPHIDKYTQEREVKGNHSTVKVSKVKHYDTTHMQTMQQQKVT